ncbi:GntR family transcriptional regulator [Microbacterium trichothecenolyticum]|uniref:GntR family transcriptional regulator n=1 Tax=Microbacterium ureisolvens TaxID=2781186 RepID=A0ABS7HZ23_9MICO|nr:MULTISPECIES: GntR family transcriptional regulator [Microbacterium]MBW9109589.1 GntR family transcriptional regulator [Microbacterium ureisolvens]MBW9120206.1 GntR family transcriptional regulator [Microbacterium trichothecenolyticum]
MTAPFVPLEPSRAVLGDEVYARLGEAILDGRLAPGDRLRDQELAEWLGVSRTPVREALQRLERAGLVEVSPHRYTRVSHPNQQNDTLELVAFNMGIAVRMASERADAETLELALERLDDVIAASRANDPDALAVASHAFFFVVTRASGNFALLQFVREYEFAIRRDMVGWRPFIECPVGRTSAYEDFRAAFVARDADRAESLLRGIHGLN